MIEIKKIYILNLVEGMGEYLTRYLSQDMFVLLSREEVDDYQKLDYIYCESVASALELAKDYDTLKNNIEIMVSKSHGDYRSFILNNGRIVIDKMIIESVANKWVLDKYFSKITNIHLEDHFPELELAEGIKITNHLLMGHFLDELSLNVFEKGFNLVPVRSFVDHTIYYFTYLRQAGLAGVPYEIEYGMSDDYLTINIHVSVKNFVAEYIMDSFGSVNSKDPLKYLLGVIARSCDFLDISYIENPNKLALVGLFYKEKVNFGQGLAFNHVHTTSQVARKVEEKILQFRSIADKNPITEKKQEQLANAKLPGGISQSVKPFQANSPLAEDDELVNKIVQFMVHQFDEKYPDLDLSDFTDYHFEEFAPFFRPEEVIQGLSSEDKENLIERIRKNNLINAYNNELDRVRDQFGQDESMLSEVNDTLGEGIGSLLGENISLGSINQMLNPSLAKIEPISKNEAPPVKLDQEHQTIFGEFKPSTMSLNLDVGDSFDIISNPFEDVELDMSNMDMGLEPQALDQIENLVLPDSNEEQHFSGDQKDLESMLVPDISGFIDDDGFALFDSALSEPLDEIVFGGDDDDDSSQVVSGQDLDHEAISNIQGNFDEEEGVIKIGGGPDDPESATTVKGGQEAADDFMQKISGLNDDDKNQFMTSFSNSFGENVDNKNFVFKSGDKKEREDNLRKFVKSTLDEQSGLDNGLKAFLHKEAPKELDKALRSYAQGLGKNIEDLSPDELKDFKDANLPKLMSDLLLDESKIEGFKKDLENYFVKEVPDSTEELLSPFQQKFKDKLEARLNEIEGVSVIDGDYTIDESQFSASELKTVVKDAFKETFKEEMKIGSLSPEEIKQKEKTIVSELSSMMGVPEDELQKAMREITQEALDKEIELVQSKLGEVDNEKQGLPQSNEGEAILLDKVKKLTDENQKLKTNVSALQLQLETEKISNKALDNINEEVSESVSEELIKASDEDGLTLTEKQKVVEELNQRDHIDPELAKKVQKALERESELIDKVKLSEMQFKKLLLENEKKDSLFKSELMKAQKAVKAKEVVLDTAKESMKNLMEKKNKEIVGLKSQVNELNHKLKDDKSQALSQQVKAVTKDNENLQRMVDIYRTKVDSLAKNMEAKKKVENNDGLSEENRNLKRIKAQLESKYQAEAKMKKTLEDRYQKSKEEEMKAKNDAVNSKAELKTLQSQLKMLKDQNTKLVQSVAAASAKKSSGASDKELEQLSAKNKKLQEKLSEATKQIAKFESQRSEAGISAAKPMEGALESRDAFFEKKAAKELELVKSQNEQLQSKIQELVDKLKKADEASNASTRSGEDNKSPNEKRLEQSIKKLNSELSKAKTDATEQKKEAIKYKAEVNKLKNKISGLEREASKNKKKAA